MALKAHMGNRLIFDDDGFAHGALTLVELVTHKDKERDGEWESYRWTFTTPGSLRPWEFREFSGMTIHPPDEKNGEVNKFTTLVLRLGILTLDDLLLDELPDHNLESAIGQCVKFKVYRKDNFYKIDLTTLALDEQV